MQRTSTTRGRYALRWVLAVGLVFVVVVGLALQAARRQADVRWESVLTHWDEAWPSLTRGLWSIPFEGEWTSGMGYNLTGLLEATQQEGNMFRVKRRVACFGGGMQLLLRQERTLFGSRINAQLSRAKPDQVEAARAILAPFDIELIVEP